MPPPGLPHRVPCAAPSLARAGGGGRDGHRCGAHTLHAAHNPGQVRAEAALCGGGGAAVGFPPGQALAAASLERAAGAWLWNRWWLLVLMVWPCHGRGAGGRGLTGRDSRRPRPPAMHQIKCEGCAKSAGREFGYPYMLKSRKLAYDGRRALGGTGRAREGGWGAVGGCLARPASAGTARHMLHARARADAPLHHARHP